MKLIQYQNGKRIEIEIQNKKEWKAIWQWIGVQQYKKSQLNIFKVPIKIKS